MEDFFQKLLSSSLSPEQRRAVELNAIAPTFGRLDGSGTMPICFTTYDSYTVEAFASQNNPAGATMASRGFREVVSVSPPELLTRFCESQYDFDRMLFARATLDPASNDALALAHYPVRSFEQLKRKALFGWLAYLANNPDAARSNQASQWRDLFDLLVSGSISAEHVSRISINYAQDRDLLADVNDVELVRDPIHSPVSPRHEPVSRSEPLIEAAKAVRGVVAGLRARKRRWPVRRKRRAGGSRRHDEKLFLDFPPFKFLWDHYRPASVLDLGCGPGGYVRQFQHWGCSRVLGVEGPGFDEKVLVSPESFRSHDLREPLNLGEMFDLVLCVEVIEHLDATHEAVLLESIIRHARDRILFSSADMDQPGVGHMNCRPQSHWLAQFERAGFVPACFESLAFRSLATFKWLRRNPILLLRSESASSQRVFGREDLDRIVSRPVD